MVEFKKDDIPKLNFILEKISKNGLRIMSNDLVKANILIVEDKNNPNDWNVAENDFVRLMYIIEKYNCAKCKPEENEDFGASITANSKTSHFIANGGFEKAYLEFLATEKHNELLKSKEINDSKLSKWQVKTFWYAFLFGFIGFVLGSYNFIDSLKTSKSKEIQEVKMQQMEKELQKLHTLILNQKKDDFLKNQKDSNQYNK